MGYRSRHVARSSKTHAVGIVLASMLGFFVVGSAAFAVGMVHNINVWLEDLPDYTREDAFLASQPTSILDANGNEIASLYYENRDNITLEECSEYVLKGMVDTEDIRFYKHNGVDLQGIVRAVLVKLAGGHQGASTITQQLVRNTVLVEEQFDQTIERKVREAYIATEMEKVFSKDEILMMYLNTIYYGHSAYGIEEASMTYFSKHANELTLPEAALLVGLPNAPSTYDPTINPDYALSRRNLVLDRMRTAGDITQEEYDAAVETPIELNVTEPSINGVYAYPYFVDYVKQQLQEEYTTDMIYRGGMTIQTTIDPTTQNAAQHAVETGIEGFGDKTLDAAVVALDPHNGYIKAMVGGRDYYDESTFEDNNINVSGQQNITTTDTRGIGSTFKVITLVTALNEGMSPNIMINCDSPISFQNGKYEFQNIHNYDLGTISLAQATALSSNTGYVQVADAIGNDKIIEMARTLGITTDLPDVMSLTLGPRGGSPLEMAGVAATIANGGIYNEPVAVLSISNFAGEELYKHEPTPQEVLDKSVAVAAINVLKGVLTGGGSGAYANPRINQPIFAKTGTTNDATDLWMIGSTPQLSVAIWTGHRDNSAVYAGYRYAATSDTVQPIFKAFFEEALMDVEREEFPTAPAPAYKPDSAFKFEADPVEEEEEETEDTEETEDEQSSENSDGTTSGGESSTPAPTPTPTPTPTPEPTPSPDPAPAPDPVVPPVPDEAAIAPRRR